MNSSTLVFTFVLKLWEIVRDLFAKSVVISMNLRCLFLVSLLSIQFTKWFEVVK